MQDSSYFVEVNLVELSRLIRQDRFATEAVGLLPAGLDGTRLHELLDIGCGPGGWLLDVVQRYPHLRGIGIDNSPMMVRMAEHLQQAEGQDSPRVHFQLMDARQPLPFPDARFDFIHLRLSQSFLWKPMWVPVLQECSRLLRPGGTLCIIDIECTFTNKPTAEHLATLPGQVYKKLGATFSCSGRSMGLLAGLRGLLPTVGFQDPTLQFHAQDNSLGRPHHRIAMEDWWLINHGWREVLARESGYTLEAFDTLLSQAAAELEEEGSVHLSLLFSLCAQKAPEAG